MPRDPEAKAPASRAPVKSRAEHFTYAAPKPFEAALGRIASEAIPDPVKRRRFVRAHFAEEQA